jgi:hypothetical protein
VDDLVGIASSGQIVVVVRMRGLEEEVVMLIF